MEVDRKTITVADKMYSFLESLWAIMGTGCDRRCRFSNMSVSLSQKMYQRTGRAEKELIQNEHSGIMATSILHEMLLQAGDACS